MRRNRYQTAATLASHGLAIGDTVQLKDGDVMPRTGTRTVEIVDERSQRGSRYAAYIYTTNTGTTQKGWIWAGLLEKA